MLTAMLGYPNVSSPFTEDFSGEQARRMVQFLSSLFRFGVLGTGQLRKDRH